MASEGSGGREDQGSTQEKKRGPPTDSEGTPEAQRQKTANATDSESGAEAPVPTEEGGAAVPAAGGGRDLDAFTA